MTAAGDSWHVVERQFRGKAWDPDTTPWREIAVTTGPDSYASAVEFARSQTLKYHHPARYRVMVVSVTDVFERGETVGPLGPDDGLCRCGDSVRSWVGTCPAQGDREFESCPKRRAVGFQPGTVLVVEADPAAGKSVWREAELMRPEIELPGTVEPTEEDNTLREWDA
jgi:hypothetical protein